MIDFARSGDNATGATNIFGDPTGSSSSAAYGGEYGGYGSGGGSGGYGGASGYGEIYGSDPASMFARMTREQFEDYKTRYRPLEDTLMGYISNEDKKNNQIDRARGLSGSQFDTSMGITRRNFERYGLEMNPDREKAFGKKEKLNRTLAKVGAANITRDNIEDRDTSLTQSMVTMGRGIAGEAGSMLGQSSSLQNQRDATNRGIKAQNKQSQMQGIGTAVGIAAMFI